jgi:hypothetical protein
MPLSDDEIEAIRTRIEGGFSPLRCVAEVYDYKQKLRYRVFDENDETVITVTDLVLRNYHDERELTDLLKEGRAKVARGFRWVSP